MAENPWMTAPNLNKKEHGIVSVILTIKRSDLV